MPKERIKIIRGRNTIEIEEKFKQFVEEKKCDVITVDLTIRSGDRISEDLYLLTVFYEEK